MDIESVTTDRVTYGDLRSGAVVNDGTDQGRHDVRREAIARRRRRMVFLIEEEGLRHGAVVRIAHWLQVSPTTIRRDIEALLAEGNTVVTSAYRFRLF